MKTKICTKCKKKKPLIEFYKHKGYKDGLSSWCKKCFAKYHKTPRSRRGQRANNLKKRFNMTLEQYDKIFKNQNGICKICGKPETKKYKGILMWLSIDHNHKTGKVRALLCDKCNRALGIVDDNINLLQKLIKYLRRN